MTASPLFGVAGNPPNFWASDYSSDRVHAPEWLGSIGLDALELQCTRGVRMSDERAAEFRRNAERYNVELSIHGPYYISIGTPDPKKIDNSLNELHKCVRLAKKLGARRIVFHPGTFVGTRESGVRSAIDALKRFEQECDLDDVRLFPEVAGKIRQLGSLDDILAICAEVDCAWPCIDFAHLHARTHGSLRSRDDFAVVFDKLQKVLGQEAFIARHLHFHMCPIEWGKQGEIRHRAFADLQTDEQLGLFGARSTATRHFLPRFEPLIEEIVARELAPLIVCEAKDSQDVAARLMKEYWLSTNGQRISTAQATC
ncbi:MAG: TIM barrel protein [Planctomycetes bacterium]|nr:TIM barrel protein [Planctomycetota bacterium]